MPFILLVVVGEPIVWKLNTDAHLKAFVKFVLPVHCQRGSAGAVPGAARGQHGLSHESQSLSTVSDGLVIVTDPCS